jgi:hypothetical protein
VAREPYSNDEFLVMEMYCNGMVSADEEVDFPENIPSNRVPSLRFGVSEKA